jgi:drug/metabolite transporter (DMT)-like permease
MVKTLALMLIAVVAVTFGDIFMSQAMKSIGEIHITGPGSLLTTVVRVLKTLRFWMALSCMATFFFLWTSILSWADLTFVLPLTALTYVLNAVLAGPFLGETIGPLRWSGVVLITMGVGLVTLSEAAKKPH